MAFIEEQYPEGETLLPSEIGKNYNKAWLLRERKAQERFRSKKEKEDAARKQQEGGAWVA